MELTLHLRKGFSRWRVTSPLSVVSAPSSPQLVSVFTVGADLTVTDYPLGEGGKRMVTAELGVSLLYLHI